MPDRIWKRLRVLAVVFALLGVLGLTGYHAAYPYRMTVAISALTPDQDGFLVGDFERPWPFKLNKWALDQISVTLPDGSEVEQAATRQVLAVAESGSGFLVERPEIVFRLDASADALGGDAVLSVTLPVKIRDIFYQLPLGLAAVLFLASSMRRSFGATLRALWWRPLALAGGALGIALVAFIGLPAAKGAFVWLALLAMLAGPLIAAVAVLQARAKATGSPFRAREALVGATLMLGAALGSCAVLEAWLDSESAELDDRTRAAHAQEEWFQLPQDIVRLADRRIGTLTLPDAWLRREETVEGASSAFTWHGVLHVHDERGFRRHDGPFQPKDPATLRIMVVGDSLTYGYGIEARWTFSRLLEQGLEQTHSVEVVNLGRSGYQSQDILWILQRFLPELDPDLVIYAVCLNDFLPSGQGEHAARAFPLPAAWKEYLWQRTRLARLFGDAYRNLLLTLDLQRDFFDDILAGGTDYRTRFASDVAAMNRFVQDQGLPPMIGIVFHQSPGGDPRAWDLVEIAERSLDNAGFDLISVMSWRERFKDRIFPVSRWEGHPNELAHSLIAEHLYERLIDHDALRAYRIDGPADARAASY